MHSIDENTTVETVATKTEISCSRISSLVTLHSSRSKEGFTKAIVNQLELTARQTLRVDVSLSVAAQTQTVEVTAAAVAVNTENATLSDSKENSEIHTTADQLPKSCRPALWRLWPYLPR